MFPCAVGKQGVQFRCSGVCGCSGNCGFDCWMKQDNVCCGLPYIPCIFRYLYTDFPGFLTWKASLCCSTCSPGMWAHPKQSFNPRNAIRCSFLACLYNLPPVQQGVGWFQSPMDSGAFPPSPITSGLQQKGDHGFK